MKRNTAMKMRLATALLPIALTLGGCAPEGFEMPDVLTGGQEDSTGNLGQNPHDEAGDIYFKAAIEYLKRGDYVYALQRAKRGLELSPSSSQGNNVIALVYEQVGENGPAETHYKRALSSSPRDSYIHNAYGAFLCKNGRYAEAEQEFQAALDNPLYQTPEVALTNSGVCAFKAGDNARAETQLRQALQRNGHLPTALYHLAEIYAANGDFTRAKSYLDRHHSFQRPTAKSLALGIRIARGMGDKNAAASYEMLLRNNFPDSEDLLLIDKPVQQVHEPANQSPYSIERSIAR